MAKNEEKRGKLRQDLYRRIDQGGLPIAEAVRSYRGVLGMTQREFAEFQGASFNVVKSVEGERGNPTQATIRKLLRGSGLLLAVVREDVLPQYRDETVQMKQLLHELIALKDAADRLGRPHALSRQLGYGVSSPELDRVPARLPLDRLLEIETRLQLDDDIVLEGLAAIRRFTPELNREIERHEEALERIGDPGTKPGSRDQLWQRQKWDAECKELVEEKIAAHKRFSSQVKQILVELRPPLLRVITRLRNRLR